MVNNLLLLEFILIGFVC